MEQRLGAVDVWCDSPPYLVVKASEVFGFRSPLDRRWCRADDLPRARGVVARLLRWTAWRTLLGLEGSQGLACTCGQRLPTLKRCGFTLSNGSLADYLFAQCPRCGTMAWMQV
jgi:hypothetical protein